MKKILCLHGKGTSGAIFKSQTCKHPSDRGKNFPTREQKKDLTWVAN